jgi:KDO2-lipid IV(A) lauroyltransferase
VDPDGIHSLTDALSRHRGVILVSAHVGDFDVIGSWLAQAMGMEVVVITDAVAERSRQAFFDDIRRAGGLILRRRRDTRLADLEGDLRAGRVVLWMLDRAARGPAVKVQWLGRPALLSVAPYALARKTGCSLIAGVTTTRADGSRSLHIDEGLRIGTSRPDPLQALTALATTLTDGILHAPWQWHVPVRREQLCFQRWSGRPRDRINATSDAGSWATAAITPSRQEKGEARSRAARIWP